MPFWWFIRNDINPNRHWGGGGGEGGMMAAQNTFTTVLKRLWERGWNLVTFNINLWSIKSHFWFPRLSSVTIETSLLGNTRDFLKFSFYMFPYNEILKFSEVKSHLIFETSTTNTSKYQISVKSVKGFGTYEHLKFRPKHRLKYRLWRHNYVIVVMSQNFWLILCRIHQASYVCQISWSSEQ